MRRLLKIFRRKVVVPKPVLDEGLPFKERYLYFKKLLSANNTVLEIMADMEEKLSGEYIFDMNYIRTSCSKLVDSVQNIIVNLDKLSKGKYPNLYFAFAKINSKIEATLTNKTDIPVTDFTIPFDSVTKEMVNSVGGKNANLGEIKNKIGLPVPEGFCISAYAFKRFIEFNELKNKIILNSVDIVDMEGLNRISREAQDLIMNSQIPPDIENSILNAFSELSRKISGRASSPTASVRSSAIHEDAQFTFAGQYKTALNVNTDNVIEQYKRVISSLFSPRAIFYYKSKGFEEDDMVMAVGVVEMIDAKASGVMYSRDPTDAEKNDIIINAVWGLGKYAVDGTVSPNVYIVSRDEPRTILEKTTPVQEVMLKCNPKEDVVEVEVPEEIRATSCLTDDQIKFLADYALVLEKHYDIPQDIEWALDENNNFFILQTRLLRILKEKPVKNIQAITSGYKILINKGQIACKGVGAGKVFFVKKEEDLEKFPEGAVLVAKQTSPKFVKVMNKTSAIVADVGGLTGHMASLAREYNVPTLLGTEIAMKTLEAGKEITVDAINGNIYEGRIEELIKAGKRENPFKDTAVFKVLRALLNNIVPLKLIDPEDEKFSPDYCETFHDITRFAHEVAMREMFQVADSPNIRKRETVKIEVKIPLEIYVIDLDGGIKSTSKKITPDQILSIPMNALLRGMMAMEWPGPPPLSVKGFFGVIASTTMQPHSERLLWEPSFAIISKEYMNFNIRLGYHIQTVEAFAGDNINDNYVRFLFKGGGASIDRRARRTRLIKEILELTDFDVKRTGDVLDARVTKYDKVTILKKLGLLARLTAYTKQLDMTLFNDAMVDWYIKEFVNKYYTEDWE
ncbi:MAG: phosphoenolpyruvate synthase [Proteobacteria bacterium]|nr:phosphoenolpyruvate synthase [Pseudomonadota bacterium]MBU4289313.1 phosphoenolpyruvate synthase [Pseudomonadota bacterium]MBU4503581.1 phosphoenolpyruvate synthase [Pseudomonadota bacterium]